MGYSLSTFKQLPIIDGYYIFLAGERHYKFSKISEFLFENFDEIAERIGKDSAIIKKIGKQNLKYDWEMLCTILGEFDFSDNGSNRFLNVDDFYPGILILKPSPSQFKYSERKFLLAATFDQLNQIYSDEHIFVNDLVDFVQGNNDNLIQKLNPEKLKLRDRIKNSFLAQPNFYGIGLDLKVLFKRTNKKQQSCVYIDSTRSNHN